MKLTLRVAKRFALILLVLLICAGLLIWYYTASLPKTLRAAEARAHTFCDAIAIGSDIATAAARAKTEGIFFGTERGYTFYFPATMFDKAVCEVTVDRGGKVLSKNALMEYD